MEFTSEKFGKCVIAEITQKQLEAFHTDMKGIELEALSVWRGNSVRSAAKRGILMEPVMSEEDVDNAKPALIVWLADCIFNVIAEAMNIDPLS